MYEYFENNNLFKRPKEAFPKASSVRSIWTLNLHYVGFGYH